MEADHPSFEALGLDPRIVSELTKLGYEEPTPIQREAIPPLLEGRDLLGQAATGTGKTAAFALPLIHRLTRGEAHGKEPRALVLVPTRELAMQVAEAVHRYGRVMQLRVLPIYGGQPMYRQLHALDRGVDVVVATPGRALDHLRRGTLTLEKIQVVVLDEADEMLDMGFAEDLEAILTACPEGHQTALFSATMAREILGIAEQHLRDPVRVKISVELAAGESPKVRQIAYIVNRQHKVAALVRILDVERPTSALVFCRTRVDVDELTETLDARGYECGSLHGGMSQEQRDRVMRRFREGSSELLIATDVAARGLDIRQLSHVINYEVPASPDDYVHRIGRTGRAGREGVALTFVEPREHRLLRNFERLTKQNIEIGRIPTVADLRAGQLELTRAALHDVLVGGELERFQSVIDALSGDYDIVDIALAAVKLAHRSTVGEHEEQEIPSLPAPRLDFDPRGRRDARGGRDDRWRARKDGPRGWEERPARGAREDAPPSRRPTRSEDAPPRGRAARDEGDAPPKRERAKARAEAEVGGEAPPKRERAAAREEAEHEAPPKRARAAAREEGEHEAPPKRARAAAREDVERGGEARPKRERGRESGRESKTPERWDVARMFIGLGRDAGVGPSDIVGAIANESGLSSQLIGAIEISDRSTVVEVPEPIVDELISVLHGATLRGRKFAVRRHVDRRPMAPRARAEKDGGRKPPKRR